MVRKLKVEPLKVLVTNQTLSWRESLVVRETVVWGPLENAVEFRKPEIW